MFGLMMNNGTEWIRVKWIKNIIPLFGEFIKEQNKYFVTSFEKRTE